MIGLFCVSFFPFIPPPFPSSSLSKVHGNGAWIRLRYASGVAAHTAVVTDADAAASTSNASCSSTYRPTQNPSHIPTHGPGPSVDLTWDFLHDAVLNDLLGALVSLFVAVAALLVATSQGAVVEGLHGLRFGEVVVIRELHGSEGAAVLLYAAGATAVVLVDAARCRGGTTQLLKALELFVQLSKVR